MSRPTKPYTMSFEHWQYTFVHGQPLAERRESYEKYVVPESRSLARGALFRAGAGPRPVKPDEART